MKKITEIYLPILVSIFINMALLAAVSNLAG